MLEEFRKLFRENPYLWAVLVAAVLTFILVVWGVYGGFQISRFFAVEPLEQYECVEWNPNTGTCTAVGTGDGTVYKCIVSSGPTCDVYEDAGGIPWSNEQEGDEGDDEEDEEDEDGEDDGGDVPTPIVAPTPAVVPGTGGAPTPAVVPGTGGGTGGGGGGVPGSGGGVALPPSGGGPGTGPGTRTPTPTVTPTATPTATPSEGSGGGSRSESDPCGANGAGICASNCNYAGQVQGGERCVEGLKCCAQAGGGGGSSGSGGAAGGVTPSPSVLRLISCTGGVAQLSWVIGANANINVLRRIKTGGSWEIIASEASRTSYVDTISVGTSYTYQVKSGASVVSNAVICSNGAASPAISASPTTVPGTSGTPTPTIIAGGGLTCAPAAQSVGMRQPTQLYVSGGDGAYVWSSGPGALQIDQGTGSAMFSWLTVGTKIVTVTSAGQTASCIVIVSDGSPSLLSPSPTLSPLISFSPTPYGSGPAAIETGPSGAIMAALTLAATVSLLYAAYTRSPAFRRREVKDITQKQNSTDFRQ